MGAVVSPEGSVTLRFIMNQYGSGRLWVTSHNRTSCDVLGLSICTVPPPSVVYFAISETGVPKAKTGMPSSIRTGAAEPAHANWILILLLVLLPSGFCECRDEVPAAAPSKGAAGRRSMRPL